MKYEIIRPTSITIKVKIKWYITDIFMVLLTSGSLLNASILFPVDLIKVTTPITNAVKTSKADNIYLKIVTGVKNSIPEPLFKTSVIPIEVSSI